MGLFDAAQTAITNDEAAIAALLSNGFTNAGSRQFGLSGVTGEILIASTAPVTALPMSLACWFRMPSVPTGTSNLLSISAKSGSTENEVELRVVTVGSTGKLDLRVTSSGALAYTMSIVIPVFDNRWHSAVCTVGATSSSTVTLYLDGIDYTNSGSGVSPSSLPIGLNCVSVGALKLNDGTITDNFDNHSVAEPAVWSSLLSASDVDALAAGIPASSISSGTLAWYVPFKGVSPEVDVVSGNNLSVTGTIIRPYGPLIRPS